MFLGQTKVTIIEIKEKRPNTVPRRTYSHLAGYVLDKINESPNKNQRQGRKTRFKNWKNKNRSN